MVGGYHVVMVESEMVTTINAFEVYYGAYRSREAELNLTSSKGFLSTVELLTPDENSARTAAQTLAELESKGQSMDMGDLLIGSIALNNGFTVLTDNKQHFERIPRLHAVTPSDIL